MLLDLQRGAKGEEKPPAVGFLGDLPDMPADRME